MVDTDRFFSKKYVIGAGWAAIFGIVGYGVRYIEEMKRGPARVVVANMPTAVSEIHATAELDQKTEADLQAMTATVQSALREMQSAQKHASAAANAEAQSRIRQLEDKITKLQETTAASRIPTPWHAGSHWQEEPPATAW